MKKYVFLTCDDLSGFVVDDEHLLDLFPAVLSGDTVDVVSWSDEAVDWSAYDVAVVRTTWDYTKNLDKFLEVLRKIEKSGCKLYNSSSIIEWNSKKTYLKDLYECGVEIIDSLFLEDYSLEEIPERVSDWNFEKLVLKPVVGAGASQIEVLTLTELIDRVGKLENKDEWFIQPFIPEVLEGELSFFYFNGVLSHAVKKVPKTGDFRVQEEYGAEITLHKANEKEILFADNVVKVLDEALLYIRVDALVTDEGLRLIELELIEPSLYLRKDPPSAGRFLKALARMAV